MGNSSFCSSNHLIMKISFSKVDVSDVSDVSFKHLGNARSLEVFDSDLRGQMPTLVSACESKNFKAGETVTWHLALSIMINYLIIRLSIIIIPVTWQTYIANPKF